jgi:LPS O-antigen subunit length determinant protein (WzzB/FepE family)
VNLNKKGVPMTAQPNYHDDEINLRDYINVLIKRKATILVVFLACLIFAVISSFTAPKVYKISQIFKAPTVGMNKTLDDPLQIKERIEEGIYDLQIKKALGLPGENELKFNFIVPEKNIFLKIYLKQSQDKVGQAKDILKELFRQLQNEYSPKVFTRLSAIENGITLKQNQIKQKLDQIKLATNTIKLIEERIASLEKELVRVNDNVEKLSLARENFIKSSNNKDNLSAVLYTTTIQQAIGYSNQLEDQLNSLKTKREQQENAIKDIKADIEAVKLKIDDLNKNKRFIENIRMLQPPTRSAKAIAPKKKQNIAIAAVIGLMLGVFVAFFREFWVNSAAKEERG